MEDQVKREEMNAGKEEVGDEEVEETEGGTRRRGEGRGVKVMDECRAVIEI